MFLPFFAKKIKHIRKRRLFLQKPWNNPFAKCRFSRLCENFTPQVWKAFFSIQNIKNCLFVAFFSPKKHIRKRSICLQKPWTDPFAKRRLFFTLLEHHFSGLKSILYFPGYQKLSLSGFLRWKRTYKKKVDFLTKTID